MASRADPELVKDVVERHKEGQSARSIARSLGVSRNTVRKLLGEHGVRREAEHSALPEVRPRAKRASKLDSYREEVDMLLERFEDITAQRVFEELTAAGFDGGYTIVKDLVREIRPAPKPEPSRATPVYGPGRMAECDWSPHEIAFTHAPRRVMRTFSYTLVHSGRKAFGFYEHEDFHALLDGHVQAFARFGGAAQSCKYDSQKSVVLRWEGRQPIYNLRFIDFATYYEFKPVAVRRGHPNDKPRVERSFWELERSFFNGRKFRDPDDLRAQLLPWMTDISDPRPNKRKGRRPVIELFAEEQVGLRSLPQHSYDTARVVYRLCDIEGYVAWEGNHYSVPYEHVTDILPVRITQRELFAYAADLTCIARHELHAKGAGLRRTVAAHHPSAHRRGADLDQLRDAFAGLGHAAERFVAELERAQPRSAAYHARRVLGLRERYDSLDLVHALEHALAYGACDYRAVERILSARARPRRLDEWVSERTARRLEEVVDSSSTEPRDLSGYDDLPCWSPPASHEPMEDTCPANHEPPTAAPEHDPSEPPPSPTPSCSSSASADTSDDSDS